MTGAFLRVERDGKWYNVEVELLTREERMKIFVGRDSEQLVRWIDMLCEFITENWTNVPEDF